MKLKYTINDKAGMGLAMPEILGAAAVLLTLASIVTLSVKDTVTATSKASMQRELQQLNTALNNFKAAGGVIPALAADDVQIAIDELKKGVELAGGGEFAPLTEDPVLSVSMDGDTYSLGYSPEGGFEYSPASGTGDPVTGGGTFGAASGTYPFDVTNPDNIPDALAAFRGLDPSDPQRLPYIDAFNAMRNLGTLSDQQEADLSSDLLVEGVYDVGGGIWAQPNPTFNLDQLPESIWEALGRAAYPVENGWAADYPDQQAAEAGGWKNWIGNLYSAPSSRSQLWLAGSKFPEVYSVANIPTTPGDWAAVTEQLNAGGWESYMMLDSLAFQGALEGSPTTWARNVDWRTVTNAQGMNFSRADLSGLDLTGFVPNGAALWRVNLAGTRGLTSQALAQSTSLAHTNMMGTGITKDGLREALIAAGKTPGYYETVTERGWILKDAVRHIGEGGVVTGYSDAWRADPDGPDTREVQTQEGDQHFNLDTIAFDPLPSPSPTPTPRS